MEVDEVLQGLDEEGIRVAIRQGADLRPLPEAFEHLLDALEELGRVARPVPRGEDALGGRGIA